MGRKGVTNSRPATSRPIEASGVKRLVTLAALTAAFAPAAVLGALPLVTSLVGVLIFCWLLLAALARSAKPAVEPPVIPAP
jgi:hypothetical protein